MIWWLYFFVPLGCSKGTSGVGGQSLRVWIAGATFLATAAHGFAPWSMRARSGQRTISSALHAIRGGAYDEAFVKALSSELGFEAETVEILHHHLVSELTLRSVSRLELQQTFNITLKDAILINAWCNAKLKEEEKAERDRLKQQKLDQSKHVRIYNEADGKYADVSFLDQNGLQTFLSGSRISALALVDATRTSSLLITTWENLVTNSSYAYPNKVREAIDVLASDRD